MSLRKIKPVVTRHNLGALRLWQEELAEIVRLVGQLPDVKVSIEADDHTLTDVETDLPQLGPRVSYFIVTGLRASRDGVETEVIDVHVGQHGSYIEASDADLTTLGLFDRIEATLKPRRRLSAKLETWFDIWTNGGGTPQEAAGGRGTAGVLALLAGAAGVIVGGVWGVAAVLHMLYPHRKTYASWPGSIWAAGIALAVAAVAALCLYLARSTLFTETHRAAPTWWERNRNGVGITTVASALSLLAGWLIAQK